MDIRPLAVGARGNVDILQMLSKDKDEYDKLQSKQKGGATAGSGVEPKALIDNPGAEATKANYLIIARPLKGGQESPSPVDDGAMAATGVEDGTHIRLESLFRRDGQQHSQGAASNVIPGPPPGGTQPSPLIRWQSKKPGRFGESGAGARSGSGVAVMLKRLMSNPDVTVEDIERQHRGQISRDQMPKPAGAEAPCTSINGAIISQFISSTSQTANVPAKPQSVTASSDEPQSANTLLKQTLKIRSKVPSSSSSASAKKPSTYPPTLACIADFGHKLSSVVESQGGARCNSGSIHSTMAPSGIKTYAQTEPGARGGQIRAVRSSPLIDPATGGRGMLGLLPVGAEDTLRPRPTSAGSSSSLTRLDLTSQPVLLTPEPFSAPAFPGRMTPPAGGSLPPRSVFQGSGDGTASRGVSGTAAGGKGGPGGDVPRVTPLTMEQMQEELLYIIKK